MIFKFVTPLVLIFSSLTSWAYVPTAESLLRNGPNPDVDEKTVLLNFTIEEVGETITGKEGAIDPSEKKYIYKFLINNLNTTRPRILVLQYDSESFAYTSIRKVKYYDLNSSRFMVNKENVDRNFFYALMEILLNNSPKILLELSHAYGAGVMGNGQLVNKEKLELLKSYKSYLAAKNENENTDFKNPMNPQDDEQRHLVIETMKQPFYQGSGQVKLVKNSQQLDWLIDGQVIKALIDHNTRQFHSLLLTTPYGVLSFLFKHNIIMSAGREFPEYFLFKNSAGKTYKITPKKFTAFNDNTNNFLRRYQKYKEHEKTNAYAEKLPSLDFISF